MTEHEGPAPAAGLDTSHGERQRIRAAIEQRCGQAFLSMSRGTGTCRLNKGHIGPCSHVNTTISITLVRLREILDG